MTGNSAVNFGVDQGAKNAHSQSYASLFANAEIPQKMPRINRWFRLDLTPVFFSILCVISVQCQSPESAWEPLWNDKDLDGWVKFLSTPHASVSNLSLPRDSSGKYTQPLGIENDPLEVFSVVELDGEKVIRISGQVFGTLQTQDDHGNFHLKLKYKWGQKKWAPRENLRRDSGLLYGGFGKPGGFNHWMESLECQIQEHDTGDFWAIGTVETNIPSRPITVGGDNLGSDWFQYHESGPMRKFGTFMLERGKRWKNRRCIKAMDAENAHGEWNMVELIYFNGNSIHIVNGQVVNRLYNSRRVMKNGTILPLTQGKILLQSEGAEVFYKDIRIRPIDRSYFSEFDL